ARRAATAVSVGARVPCIHEPPLAWPRARNDPRRRAAGRRSLRCSDQRRPRIHRRCRTGHDHRARRAVPRTHTRRGTIHRPLAARPHAPCRPRVRPTGRRPDRDAHPPLAGTVPRGIARVVDPPEPGDAEQEVVVVNAADRAAIVAALSGGSVPAPEDRFVVYLASVHPYRARFFRGAAPAPIALAAFDETLPNR